MDSNQSKPDAASASPGAGAQPEAPARPRTRKERFARMLRQLRSFAFVILVVLSLRSSIADWNDVPTGSMKPSILEGDRIFVNKLAYDLKVPFTTWHLAEWDNPQRGEVVVFYSPQDGIRLVKRVIGVPGDVLELRDNKLYVNGQPADYQPLEKEYVEQIGPAATSYQFAAEAVGGRKHPVMVTPSVYSRHRSYGPVTVPPGQYFVMGDNRDNSNDSRFYGAVDRKLIVGKALSVVLSLDPDRSYKPRWDRFFTPLP
jgi:signal peptidase I